VTLRGEAIPEGAAAIPEGGAGAGPEGSIPGGGVQLVLLRASWQQQDKGPPKWEACAARTGHGNLVNALFYKVRRRCISI